MADRFSLRKAARLTLPPGVPDTFLDDPIMEKGYLAALARAGYTIDIATMPFPGSHARGGVCDYCGEPPGPDARCVNCGAPKRKNNG